jgi:hypothetical protein
MPTRSPAAAVPPARTHQQALELFRRPFAPGAIGFRAMTKVPHGDDPWGGAQVAAYLSAQSVLQRLNTVTPGRWRMDFHPLPGELAATGGDTDRRHRLYLACRLIISLPLHPAGPDIDAVYEDVGELDAGSLAGLKALYSDARKRAAVAAGIGAYLYTALEAVVLPLGPGERHVQCLRRPGKTDLLTLTPATERWLRDGYRSRMSTDAVLRDLGPILAHGEPEHTTGQGESADQADHPPRTPADDPAAGTATQAGTTSAAPDPNGRGELVTIDFAAIGPEAPPAA